MTPKGDVKWVLAFLVPTSQHMVALNAVHCDVGHQEVQVAWVVLASPVPPAELSPEMEAALEVDAVQEHMSVTTWQENCWRS